MQIINTKLQNCLSAALEGMVATPVEARVIAYHIGCYPTVPVLDSYHFSRHMLTFNRQIALLFFFKYLFLLIKLEQLMVGLFFNFLVFIITYEGAGTV